MVANGRQDAYQSLISLADKQGYVTFDDIMRSADDYSLSIQDLDWLSGSISARGVLIYADEPNSQSVEDAEYDDFAQSDYEKVYNRIVELCPSLEPFVTQVRNIVPPQYKEISRLKYQIVDGNAHARARMIEMHLRSALRIALGRAEQYDLDIVEVVGEACVGLMNAVDKYDPDNSGPFISYASYWIFQNISRMQETKRPLVYYPVHRKEGFLAIYTLAKKRGCLDCDIVSSCPTLREYIKEKRECNDTEAGYVVDQMVPFSSIHDLTKYELDSEYADERDIPAEILQLLYSDEEGELLSRINSEQLSVSIDDALSHLKEKEAEVLRLRYGFYGKEMTLEEVGHVYHVTRERIRQIEAAALRKLRSQKYRHFFTGYID